MAASTNFSSGALQRRLAKKAPGMGAPGPRGGKKQLAPGGTGHAGSMIKKGKPEGGRGKMTRALAKGIGK